MQDLDFYNIIKINELTITILEKSSTIHDFKSNSETETARIGSHDFLMKFPYIGITYLTKLSCQT